MVRPAVTEQKGCFPDFCQYSDSLAIATIHQVGSHDYLIQDVPVVVHELGTVIVVGPWWMVNVVPEVRPHRVKEKWVLS